MSTKTHEEVLNDILASHCNNPVYEEGKFDEATQTHVDGWREWHFDGHCSNVVIVARLISAEGETPYRYEIRDWGNPSHGYEIKRDEA